MRGRKSLASPRGLRHSDGATGRLSCVVRGGPGTGHGGSRVRNGWRSPMSRLGTMQRARRRAAWVIVCASGASAFAQPVVYLPAPRPPAPVYNGSDVAAVNATINRFGFDFVTVGAPGNRSWNESE